MIMKQTSIAHIELEVNRLSISVFDVCIRYKIDSHDMYRCFALYIVNVVRTSSSISNFF